MTAGPAPLSLAQLSQKAGALRAQGRADEAIEAFRAALAAYPASVAAAHNLAAALGDGGRWAEAEPILGQAFTNGADAPETWLVAARCAQHLGRLEAAETAFRQCLRRRSLDADAHRELAQLRWMRGADIETALADLNAALAAAPGDARLIAVKVRALESAGLATAAYALASEAARAAPDAAELALCAAQTGLAAGEFDAALVQAERAAALAPQALAVRAALVEALLATEKLDAAERAAEDFRRLAPDNQHALALLAVIWRFKGDSRYRALYDYDAFVRLDALAAPPQWPSLEAYLADLAAALNAAHVYNAHPFAQSVRHGGQISNIFELDHAAARALPDALAPAIRRYLAALGRGDDPLRSRNNGAWRCHGPWSVRLKAGGWHANHVHPEGWVSAVCHVEVPASLNAHEGALKLGEPGMRTGAPLAPERRIAAAPGQIVFFPSYMWHGVVPFSAPGARLAFAFDLTPA